MTLEETIKKALDKCAMSGWRLAVLQTEIACVAKAAIEEEREACAQYLAKLACIYLVDRDSASYPSEQWARLDAIAHMLEEVGREIRARSNGRGKKGE